jgi:hypothetical protein
MTVRRPSHSESARRSNLPVWALLFVPAVLGILGGIQLLAGIGAIQQQSYDLNWEATRTVHLGPLAVGEEQSSGVVEYRGADGVRAGVGLVALGILLLDWSGLMIWGLVWCRTGRGGRRLFRHLLGWLSFACLIVSLGSFFPPWRLHAAGFWAVALLGSVAPPLLVWTRRPSWIGGLIVTLILLTVVAGYFGIALSVSLFLALIATLIGYVHLFVLVPALGRWMLATTAPPAAQPVVEPTGDE